MADLLTLAEAADKLRVSVRTLEREARDGKLAIIRIRSVRLIDPKELERYIAACPSVRSEIAGKSGFELVQEAVSKELSRLALPAPTQGRSKLRSGARASTLQLVENRKG